MDGCMCWFIANKRYYLFIDTTFYKKHAIMTHRYYFWCSQLIRFTSILSNWPVVHAPHHLAIRHSKYQRIRYSAYGAPPPARTPNAAHARTDTTSLSGHRRPQDPLPGARTCAASENADCWICQPTDWPPELIADVEHLIGHLCGGIKQCEFYLIRARSARPLAEPGKPAIKRADCVRLCHLMLSIQLHNQ